MTEPDALRRRPIEVSVAVLLLVLVAACGGGDTALTTVAPPDGTTPPSSTVPADAGPRHVIDAAVEDLAARVDADPSSIHVVSVEAVTWSDGSLGCPEEGKMYTQALVDGHRVVLSHDGTDYDYHAGNDGDPFLCESPGLEPGPDSSLTRPTTPES